MTESVCVEELGDFRFSKKKGVFDVIGDDGDALFLEQKAELLLPWSDCFAHINHVGLSCGKGSSKQC